MAIKNEELYHGRKIGTNEKFERLNKNHAMIAP
jgi:hypothetical protein